MKKKVTVMDPFSVSIDLEKGMMRKAKHHLVRRASDMKGHYADAAALDALIRAGNPVHYEVFEIPVPETYGHLMYCISKLHPGLVGDEFFMTKGHYHTVVETAELYLCLRRAPSGTRFDIGAACKTLFCKRSVQVSGFGYQDEPHDVASS